MQKPHKIDHLCCKTGAKFKAENGKHLYQCNGCGQTTRGTDRTIGTWRDKHVNECFQSYHYVLENSGTQADFISAVKAGKVPGVKFDRHGPRNSRFTWRMK